MVEVRQLTPVDAKDAIALSDKVFRDDEHKSMGEAFPYIFREDCIHQSFGAFKDGELVCFMGLVPSVIRIGEARVSVYSLGSVCTDPDHRGEGHASALMDAVLAFVKTTDASLLLVSGDRNLYKRANCFPFGSVTQYMVTNKGEVSSDYKIRKANGADLLKIASLSSKRDVAYEQTTGDLVTLIKGEAHPSCAKQSLQVLVAEKENQVVAYLAVGVPYEVNQSKGTEAYEWAGENEAVLPLVQYALKNNGLETIKVPVPFHESELHQILSDFESKLDGNQGTVHIIDSERLFAQLNPYIGEKLEIVESPDSKALAQKIFGYKDVNHEGKLPIPFPYTAGLNYV